MVKQTPEPTEAQIVFIVESAIRAEKNPNALHGMSASEAENHYALVSRVLPHVPDSHKYLVMALKVRIQREYHLDDGAPPMSDKASEQPKFSDDQLYELENLIRPRGLISDEDRASRIVEWVYKTAPLPLSLEQGQALIKAWNAYIEVGEQFSQHYAQWVRDSHKASLEIAKLLKPYETPNQE